MRDSIRVLLIAILAIAALSVVAATIESTTAPQSSGPGEREGGGSTDNGLLPPPQNMTTPGLSLRIPFLSEILLVLAVVVAVSLPIYLYVYWRAALRVLVSLALLLGFVSLFTFLLGSLLGFGDVLGFSGDNSVWSLTSGGGADAPSDQPSLPSVLLLLALTLTLVGTVIAFFKSRSGTEDSTPEASSEPDVDTRAVSEVAGRAADRLEHDADVDNEVYRAWQEMTELLELPDPETSTPADFATAAVEANMDEDAVADLTRLFEEVRYGERAASPEREEAAIRSLRRIESRYAEDDP
jgi:hypothetical protein